MIDEVTKRACLPRNPKKNRTGLFAVVDGKEEPLTQAEVFHIFQDEEIES
jgi:hypothetical protein